MTRFLRRLAFAVLFAAMLLPFHAKAADDTIKIAFIAPFSGAFAPQGDAFLKQLQFSLDAVNAKGGALGKKFEIVTFDDKLQPAEATIALKSATDANIPFILQCIGSNVAAAMVDGVAKYNARNPERRVLYLNCAALANELTNEQCDFWHFRFVGNVSMRVETMVRSLPKSLKSVYLINQDYLYGQSVESDLKTFLGKLRPDIKIVGADLVPLGKIKDFSSYVTKVKTSGAEALLTSNWGVDFNQLIKSGVETGLNVGYYTFSAHLNGGPTAMGEAGVGRVHAVLDFQENIPSEIGNAEGDAWMAAFRAKYLDFDFVWVNYRTMFEMLRDAVNKAGTTDALQVALALEDLQAKDITGQSNTMRKTDHQMLVPFYQALFSKGVKYDSEKTGFGWKTENTVPAAELNQPTSCKMKRPAGA
jgi:branched-chain amino acid transport system substrate-binding protein